jgi:hypothetical protein
MSNPKWRNYKTIYFGIVGILILIIGIAVDFLPGVLWEAIAAVCYTLFGSIAGFILYYLFLDNKIY